MKNSQKTFISKLKRNKISVKQEGYKIIIGKAKFDYATFFGLIILPLLGVIPLIFILNLNSSIVENNFSKIVGGIISFAGISIYNLIKFIRRRKFNSSHKTLFNNQIVIDNKIFNYNNTLSFFYTIQERDDEFEGIFYLIDNEENLHLIFQLEDNPQYLESDLKYYKDYFSDYLRLTT